MASYSVAQAKNELPRLIDKAMNGEEVVITRRGLPVVEVRATWSATQCYEGDPLERLRELRDQQKPSGLTSVELLREMYEDDE